MAVLSLLTFNVAKAQDIYVDATNLPFPVTDGSTFYLTVVAYDISTKAVVGKTNPLTFDKTTNGILPYTWAWPAGGPAGTFMLGLAYIDDGGTPGTHTPSGPCSSPNVNSTEVGYGGAPAPTDDCFTVDGTAPGGTVGDQIMFHAGAYYSSGTPSVGIYINAQEL